jgi:hypothetical protein
VDSSSSAAALISTSAGGVSPASDRLAEITKERAAYG